MANRTLEEISVLKGKTVGELMAGGLEEFVDELQNDKAGATKKFICRKITLDLAPTTYDPDLVRGTRRLLRASQAVFAQFLGVPIQAVRAWEEGVNQPSDSAARLMDEIRHDPPYWRKRMSEVVITKSSRTVTT